MDIFICIGSSCHLKGSRSVIEKMEDASIGSSWRIG